MKLTKIFIYGIILLVILLIVDGCLGVDWNKPINMPEGAITEGRIICYKSDGIYCRQYTLATQPVCWRDKDLVEKYCD